VPEFVDALDKYPVHLAEAMRANSGRLNPAQSMTAATRDLYRLMNQNEEVTPLILVQVSGARLFFRPYGDFVFRWYTQCYRISPRATITGIHSNRTPASVGRN
jgi:hypothetical protein